MFFFSTTHATRMMFCKPFFSVLYSAGENGGTFVDPFSYSLQRVERSSTFVFQGLIDSGFHTKTFSIAHLCEAKNLVHEGCNASKNPASSDFSPFLLSSFGNCQGGHISDSEVGPQIHMCVIYVCVA